MDRRQSDLIYRLYEGIYDMQPKHLNFYMVPVLRKEERLMLGPDQFFLFETEDWLTNFFDGTK